MRFVVEDMLAGGIIALVAAALFFLGTIVGGMWITSDCEAFGAFKAERTIYQCKKITPDSGSRSKT